MQVDWAEKQWTADTTNSMRRWGFYAVLAFVFIRFSMVSEILEFGLGLRAYLVMGLGPIAILLMVLSGGARRSMREKPSYFLAAYMGWLLICAPFSVWKGGTFAVLKMAFLTEFSMYFMIAGLILTIEEIRKLVLTISLAVSVDLVALAVYGESSSGRLSMSFGTLQNPNDLAIHLISTIPFVLLSIHLTSAFSVWRFLALPTVLGALYVVLRTGSRMGLVSLAVTGVFLLLRASLKQRMLVLATAVPAIALALVLLPQLTLQRYVSIFSQPQSVSSAEELEELRKSQGSSEARFRLLEASLQLTLENPLFGVGPGQFVVEDADRAKQEGRRAQWQVTHNTYTEISSEAGVPALAFLVAAILCALYLLNRMLLQARGRPDQTRLATMAFHVMLALFGFAVCSFFGSMAYRFYMPSLVAIGVILVSAGRRELAAREVATDSGTGLAAPKWQPEASPEPVVVGPGPVKPKTTRGSGAKRISPLRH